MAVVTEETLGWKTSEDRTVLHMEVTDGRKYLRAKRKGYDESYNSAVEHIVKSFLKHYATGGVRGSGSSVIKGEFTVVE